LEENLKGWKGEGERHLEEEKSSIWGGLYRRKWILRATVVPEREGGWKG